jgi:hypothetical protein
VQIPVLVTGQIHHRGHGTVLLADLRGAPNVFVHAQSAHPGQPRRVRQAALRLGLDGVPAGVPVHCEMTGEGGDGGVVVLEGVARPRHGPGSELGPWRQEVVLFAERRHRARRIRAAPDPVAPAHPHRRPEARGITGLVDPAAVSDGDHPTTGAAGQVNLGLHRHAVA